MTDAERKPLLEWLVQQHPGTPRSRAKQWIVAGRVRVAGVVIRRPHESIPDPAGTLQLGGHGEASLAVAAGWQFHPRVGLVHLDPALAVLNKGAGIIAVPAPGCELSALSVLSDFLAGKLRPKGGDTGRTVPPAYRRLQPLPVHRLDQYTTGLFCVAMTPAARSHLIEQLKTHTMKREYVAFAEGRPPTTKGAWRGWLQLTRDELRQQVLSDNRARQEGVEAREAVTHFEVLAEYPLAGGKSWVTKLRLCLETGRKHQIRVQAANAGLPLVGDRTYNPALRAARPSAISFPRQALHSEVLTLEHPDHFGRQMTWRAEMPADLRELENWLRRHGSAPRAH